MSDTMQEELEDLLVEFDVLGDWEQQLHYVMDLGKALPRLTDAQRIDANKVQGCASKVWIVTEPGPNRTLGFRAESDSPLVQGLIAVLLRLYSGRNVEEILAFDLNAAFEALDLKNHLTRQRSNGFFSMVERIRRDARAVAARA